MKKELERFMKEVAEWKSTEEPGRKVKYFLGNATFLKLKVEKYNRGEEADMPFSEPDRVKVSIYTPNGFVQVIEFTNKTFEEVCVEISASGFASDEAVEGYLKTVEKIDTTVDKVKKAGAKALFAFADIVSNAADKVKEATAPNTEASEKEEADVTEEGYENDGTDDKTDYTDKDLGELGKIFTEDEIDDEADEISDEDFPDDEDEEADDEESIEIDLDDLDDEADI